MSSKRIVFVHGRKMRKASNLTLKSPVSSIQGIGENRANALSELEIYSIEDFLEYTKTPEGVLSVAGTTGMKTSTILELRSRVEKELQKSEPSSIKEKWYRKHPWIFFLLLAVLNLLFITTGILIETTSFYHYHHPSYTVTALFTDLGIYSYYDLKVSSQYNATDVKTEVHLKSNFSYLLCDQTEQIPQGILFAFLTESDLKNFDAVMYVTGQKDIEMKEGWVTLEKATELAIPLPVTIQNVSHLENYPGINRIAWINAGALNEAKQRIISLPHPECRFEFRAMFVDNISGANFFDTYRKGVVSVSAFIYYTEAKFIGIEDLPDDGLGSILKLDSRPDGYNTSETLYMWESTIDGEFIKPDDLVGSRRFVEIKYSKPIETNFSFKTEGAKWIPYLAGILGFQVIIGASKLITSKFKRF